MKVNTKTEVNKVVWWGVGKLICLATRVDNKQIYNRRKQRNNNASLFLFLSLLHCFCLLQFNAPIVVLYGSWRWYHCCLFLEKRGWYGNSNKKGMWNWNPIIGLVIVYFEKRMANYFKEIMMEKTKAIMAYSKNR